MINMPQTQVFPILLAALAGLSNGAYLSPLKHGVKTNCFIWIAFGFLAFFSLPLLTLLVVITQKTFFLPPKYFLYILAVGFVYGIGMYFLTKSVQYIGLGIPFALSIATGTLSGSLFSIALDGHFSSMVNNKTILAYLIFIISIALYSFSLSIRDKRKNVMWLRGLILCVFSSILCATQGACLAYFSNYFKAHGQGFQSQLAPWSLIFISCSVIFIISHYWDSRKLKEKLSLKEAFKPALIMTALYSVSIVLYTIAITKTASYSEQYLWVIFMGVIILSSTICSYIKGEWCSCKPSGNLVNFSAIGCLVISIILLTFSI